MPRQIDHEVRREDLADALWRIAAREGIGAATIRAVASEAGWSTGALRHYAPSQTSLLATAFEQANRQTSERLDRLAVRTLDLTIARRVLEALLPMNDRRRAEAAAWFSFGLQRDRPDEIQEQVDRHDALVRGTVLNVIAGLEVAGLLGRARDPVAESWRLHVLLDGLVIQGLAQPPVLSPDHMATILRLHLEELTR